MPLPALTMLLFCIFNPGFAYGNLYGPSLLQHFNQTSQTVSHLKERKPKDCLNCGAEVHGRYCHICGQENAELRESFWHLLTHFVYDITHFDGKFFSTVKYLLLRPGYLSYEYMKGRRTRFLNPIRMYVFTSAIFFLISFATSSKDDDGAIIINDAKEQDRVDRLQKQVSKELASYRRKLYKADSGAVKTTVNLPDITNKIVLLQKDSALLTQNHVNTDSLWFVQNQRNSTMGFGNWFGSKKYASDSDYLRKQKALPEEQQDGFLKKRLVLRELKVRKEYHNDEQAIKEQSQEKFLHSIPKIMFVSLPLVALIFQILYFSRKQYYYVNHGIFVIHNYIAIYLLLMLNMLLSWARSQVEHPDWLWKALIVAVSIYIPIYVYKGMRKFYLQRRWKTILKFALLAFALLILFTLLMIAGFLVSSLTA
jgi:hypothetical protein